MRLRTDSLIEKILLATGYAVFSTYLIGYSIMYAWNNGLLLLIELPTINYSTALILQCVFNFIVALKYYWD